MDNGKKTSWTTISWLAIVSTIAFQIVIWILLGLRPDSSGYGLGFIASVLLNSPSLLCGSVSGLITSCIGSWRGEKSHWLESAFWINSFLFIASIGMTIVLTFFTRFI
jgi:hypothetical protein